jgi:hypothetical protein
VHKRRHQDAINRRRRRRGHNNNNIGHIVCSSNDDVAERRKVNQLAGAAGQERSHYLGEFLVQLFLRQFSVQQNCPVYPTLFFFLNRSIQPYFVFVPFSSLVYDRRGNFTTRAAGNRAKPTIFRNRRPL